MSSSRKSDGRNKHVSNKEGAMSISTINIINVGQINSLNSMVKTAVNTHTCSFKGPNIYIPPLTRKPEQQWFTK